MCVYYIYTLTGHFIRYNLLAPVWTHFCRQNCLNSSWDRFNKVLETFLRVFGPYWHDSITQLLQICTSMMRISRSSTSQRCFIGLRSGDCGGHFSKINDKCTAILNIRYWSNYINLTFMPIIPQVKLCKPITFHEMVHLTIHLLDSWVVL